MKHKLKLKLFFSIFSASLIALVFFGLVAYDSAINTSYEREAELLDGFSDHFVLHLLSDLNAKKIKLSQDSINQWLHHYKKTVFGLAIFTKDGNALNVLKSQNITKYFVTQLIGNNESGSRNLDNQTYTWNSRNIPDSPYYIAVIHKVSEESARSFFNSLGVPLIITAAVLLWLSTWVTIYLTSLYDRLNKQKNELEFQAQHDPLTKMINRSLYLQLLGSLCENAEQQKIPLSLCYLSINNFKDVNCTLGHDFADELLIAVANRCCDIAQEKGYVARLGAAEFAIILPDHDVNEARNFAESVLKDIEDDITINNIKLNVSVNIGIVSLPEHAQTMEELIQRAEIAIHNAKKLGSRITIFHSDLLKSYQPNLNLISLKSAGN